MAYSVLAQTNRPGVHFSVSNVSKKPSAGAIPGTESVSKVKLYVTEEGVLCATGKAFLIDGETVIFRKTVIAKVQDETLIIKNSRV